MKDNIIVLIDTYYLKAAPAGIKTYINQLVQSTKISKSHNIKYICSSTLNPSFHSISYLNSENRLMRWIFQIKYFFWKQVVLPLQCIKHNADFLICPDYVLPFWNLNLKKIVVLHDSMFWVNKNDYSKVWRFYYLKSISIGIDKGTTIVTTSLDAKKSLKKVLKIKNRIEVIYQSCSKFSKLKNANDEKIILHVGSFEKRKNLITLVKAFLILKNNSKNHNLKLVLAGSTNFFGNSIEFKKINNFIKTNNLQNEIKITGHLSDEQVRELYSRAYLYVFPSNSEGFGIPIIESFASSTPVICTNIGVFNEIGKDAILTFEKNDYLDLSSKMELLIGSKKLRKELILKGQERLKAFSNENFIDSYEKLFKIISK